MPEDIRKLGAEGVNKIWRNAKLRGAGMKRAQTLVSAAEHSVGSKEAPETARMDELLRNIEEKPGEIPYVDKLMEIKGIGLVSVLSLIHI